MKDTYGFQITDHKGLGFQRWFNTDEILYQDQSGKLPYNLYQIYLAQRVKGFYVAYDYCKLRANDLGLLFKQLTEDDFKKTGNPISELFSKIFRHGKKKQI